MVLSLQFEFRSAWSSWTGGVETSKQFSSPRGIALDSSGNVYVADYGNQRVVQFDPLGNYINSVWGIGNPTDVAVDASGNLYIAVNVGRLGSRILKYDSTLTTQIVNFSGTADYQLFNGAFDEVLGVTLDPSDEFVYVVDSTNCFIVKFYSTLLSTGSSAAKWGGPGTKDGEFAAPTKAAVDLHGNVYVTDSGNNRIQQFDSLGNYINTWGSQGHGTTQVEDPMGVAASIIGYDPPPNEPSPVPTRGIYEYLFVADTGNDRCQVIGGFGAQFGSSVTNFGLPGSNQGQFKGPRGVAVRDYVYVADSENNRVQVFSWGWSRSDL